jgi:signal peptidase I
MIRCFLIRGKSMEAHLHDGDLIVTTAPRKVPRPGDVVVYTEKQRGFFVAHRVEALGSCGALTRGDANAAFDPLPVARGQIVGRLRMTIPWLGLFVARLRAEDPKWPI